MKKRHLLFLFTSFFLQMAIAKAEASNFEKSIDIGQGRRLYLKCSGTGSPTVILESGYRNNSDVWTVSIDKRPAILPAVASFTRVCAYDRPDTIGWTVDALSRSSLIPMPRSIDSVTYDLHALLQAANVPGPYILVGHSLGGVFMRLYASEYPNEVAGLILVDALPEQLKSFLGPSKWDAALKMMQAIPSGIKDTTHFETIDFNKAITSLEKTMAHSSLKPMPLIVLSRGKVADLPMHDRTLTSADFEKAWQAGQAQLVTLVPHATHITATKSPHYIQYAQPQLIIDAIHTMVRNIREGNPVPVSH